MSDQTLYRILVVNPGSTSTKIAVFENQNLLWNENIKHPHDELKEFGNIWEQFDFRKEAIHRSLSKKGFALQDFSAIVGRGGLLKPITGGTYRVNQAMLEDARKNLQGEHVSNLGCALAYEIAKQASQERQKVTDNGQQVYDCQLAAFIVDPVSINEFEPLAWYSGHPAVKRRSVSHALNIHAVARRAAEQLQKRIEEANFVVAHLGGGISITPVSGGKIIDANDATSDGPFSPERTGGLPLQQFIELCFSANFQASEIRQLVMGKGGLVAYLGTSDAGEVERRIAGGDTYAREVYEAMAYQVAKEIGAMATVLKGRLDAIVLTGGLAHSKLLTDWITERVSFIAKVILVPGEDEMRTMAEGTLRVLRGEESAKVY